MPFVWHGYADLLRDAAVRTAIRARLCSWPIAFMVVNNFEFAFFAWSAKHIDIAATAILFETWPVLLIALTLWLYRNEERYRRSSFSMWLLVAVGFAGFAFVVLSQSAATGVTTGADVGAVTAGVALAVIASAVTSLSAFGFKWGHRSGRGHRPGAEERGLVGRAVRRDRREPGRQHGGDPREPRRRIRTGRRDERRDVRRRRGRRASSATAGATLCWRNANLITRNLGINAIGYATPALSLGVAVALLRGGGPRGSTTS